MEYVGAKRRAYAMLKSKAHKTVAIDEFRHDTAPRRHQPLRRPDLAQTGQTQETANTVLGVQYLTH